MNAYINNRKWYFPILFFRFISKGIFIFCLFLLFSCVFKSEAYANTYYVDSSITDTNPASATPDFTTYNSTTFETTGGSNSVYKTIADVNLKSFSPGDNIYFRRGQTWNEQLTIAQSGTVVNRITFGAYGSGNKPIIDAQNTRNYAITTLVSFNYVTIQDIQVQNGTFANIWFDNSTSGLILNNLTSESGVRGIWIRKASNATYTKITANNSTSNCFYIGQLGTNVTINDINASGCSGYPAIYIYQLTDVVATNLTAINNYNGGIQFLNNVGNVTVSNSVSTGNTGIGVELLGNVSGNSVNYLLDNITSSYNSTKGFDIQLLRDGAVEVLIDNSLSEHNGDNGIELDITKNITIQNSIIRYNSLNGIGAWYTANDNISIVNCKVNNNLFDGVSFHGSSSGVLVERCESYSNGTVGSNNSGDGYTSHETVILKIHNSIAHDNLNSGVAIINATAGEVFNSTFYNNGSVGFSRGGYWSEVSGGTGWIVKNNIFSNNYPYEFFTDSNGINFTTADNNLYYHPADNKVATLDAGSTYQSWATFHTINGYQPNSNYADPLFSNISASDFHLNRLSPAINAGTNLGFTTDFAGTSVPQGSSPDIGAYEYIPLTVAINQSNEQYDPTLGTSINFTAIFSEPVTNFQTGDVNITGTAGATTATITGSGTTYNIAVTGMTHTGTVIANIPADIATGSTENTNNASTSTYNQVTYDISSPIISSILSTPISVGTLINWSAITWLTDETSSSQIEYGLTNTYGHTTSETDTTTKVTDHSVVLSNLFTCTTYHYKIHSKDTAGNEAISEDNTFTTLGCPGSATIEAENGKIITTALGGTLSLLTNDNGFTLTVPTTYSTSNADFQIKKLDKTNTINATSIPIGYLLVGSYLYDLKALTDVNTSVSTFSKDLTVSIKYDDTDILGLDETSLKIYTWDDDTWTVLPNCSVNMLTNTITCTTNHFSVFGLFGQTVTVVEDNPVVTNPVVEKTTTTSTNTKTTDNTTTDTSTTDNTNTGTTTTPVDNTKTTEVKENTTKKNTIPVLVYAIGGGIIIGCILLGVKYIKKGKEER